MSIRAISWVWDNSPASGSELLLLLAIADYANADGTGAYPSISTLAQKTRQSERNVQYLVKALENKGELVIIAKGGPRGCNIYNLVIDREGVKGVKTGAEGVKTGVNQDAIAIAPDPSGSVIRSGPTVDHDAKRDSTTGDVVFSPKEENNRPNGKYFSTETKQQLQDAYRELFQSSLPRGTLNAMALLVDDGHSVEEIIMGVRMAAESGHQSWGYARKIIESGSAAARLSRNPIGDKNNNASPWGVSGDVIAECNGWQKIGTAWYPTGGRQYVIEHSLPGERWEAALERLGREVEEFYSAPHTEDFL